MTYTISVAMRSCGCVVLCHYGTRWTVASLRPDGPDVTRHFRTEAAAREAFRALRDDLGTPQRSADGR